MVELVNKNNNVTYLFEFLEKKITNSRSYTEKVFRSATALIAKALNMDADDVALEIKNFSLDSTTVMENFKELHKSVLDDNKVEFLYFLFQHGDVTNDILEVYLTMYESASRHNLEKPLIQAVKKFDRKTNIGRITKENITDVLCGIGTYSISEGFEVASQYVSEILRYKKSSIDYTLNKVRDCNADPRMRIGEYVQAYEDLVRACGSTTELEERETSYGLVTLVFNNLTAFRLLSEERFDDIVRSKNLSELTNNLGKEGVNIHKNYTKQMIPLHIIYTKSRECNTDLQPKELMGLLYTLAKHKYGVSIIDHFGLSKERVPIDGMAQFLCDEDITEFIGCRVLTYNRNIDCSKLVIIGKIYQLLRSSFVENHFLLKEEICSERMEEINEETYREIESFVAFNIDSQKATAVSSLLFSTSFEMVREVMSCIGVPKVQSPKIKDKVDIELFLCSLDDTEMIELRKKLDSKIQ